jgi:hypothetical protein
MVVSIATTFARTTVARKTVIQFGHQAIFDSLVKKWIKATAGHSSSLLFRACGSHRLDGGVDACWTTASSLMVPSATATTMASATAAMEFGQ